MIVIRKMRSQSILEFFRKKELSIPLTMAMTAGMPATATPSFQSRHSLETASGASAATVTALVRSIHWKKCCVMWDGAWVWITSPASI